MSITAPSSDRAPEGELTREHDAIPRMDHRVLREAVDLADAGPGRYLVAEGEGRSRAVRLVHDVVHVGRSFTAHVRLDDSAVSRRHAIIVLRSGGARVLDDRSANGTFVNGRRITEAELRDGDVLAFGGVALTYREM